MTLNKLESTFLDQKTHKNSYLKKDRKIFIFDNIFMCLIQVNPQQCVKNWKSAFENFFYGKELIFKNFYFTKMCKSEIKNNNKAICSRLSETVSIKINFTRYDPHGDHPPA